MKKYLSLLMLIAALVLPWASQAQGTAITSFPWSCDFEDTTVNAAWTYSNASNGWYVGTATSNGGTHSLYVSDNSGTGNSYSGSACVSYAYLTLDIASAGQYALSFDWKCQGESTYDFLRVAVTTATTALPTSYSDWTATAVPSGFIAVDGGNKLNLQGTTWQNVVSTFNVTAAGTYRLVFAWRNDGSVYNVPPAAIDNVQIAELTCPQPTALSCLPSPTQLDFTWTAGGTESAWRVVFNDSVDEDVYTNSYSVTGLTANTPYNFKVYSLCDAGDTSFATQGTFRTACDFLTTLPFAYGFEDAATGSSTTGSPFVDCWGHLNNGTSYGGYPYVGSSTYAHTGSKGLYWYNTTTTGTYGDYECVVLPPADPDIYPVNTLQLRFWAKASSTSYYPVFQVGVMTDPGDITTFTQVGTVNISGTDWTEQLVTLAPYTGNGTYVALKSERASWTAYVDDFTLEVAPACPAVCGMDVEGVGITSASVSWQTRGGVETPLSYDVEIVEVDTTGSATPDTYQATSMSYTFTGLNAGTQYKVRVRANCTSENGEWDSITFATASLGCWELDPTTADTLAYATGTTGMSGCLAYSSYGNTVYQAIWTAAELTAAGLQAGTITGIDLGFTGCSSYTKEFSIYMTNSNVTSISNATMVVPTEGDLKYGPAVHPTNTTGYQHYEFDSPFQWDGASSIMITTFMNQYGATQTASTGLTGYYTSAANKARYRYKDSSPFTLSDLTSGNAGSTYSYRANITFYTGECMTYATCVAPNAIIDSVFGTEIYVSWAPGYDESVWDVDYRATDDNEWTNVETATSNTSTTITNLNTNTNYQVRVGSLCSDTTIYTVLNVRTTCGDFTVPYTEDFESYGSGTTAFPTCWFKKGSTADRLYINATTSYGHNNTHGLYFYAASGGYCYAILPRTSHAIDSLQVSFWARQYSTSYNCSFVVGVMTDPDDLTTFVAIDTVHPNGTTYEEFEVSLHRYTGTGRYIAFSGIINSGSYLYMMLDDVTVDYIPTCPRTSPIQVDSVGLDYIALRWSENGEASQWVIEYDTVNFVPGAGLGNLVYANDTSYLVYGLDSATTYYFYLHADCGGGDTSYNKFLSVATLAASPATVPYTCDFEEDGPNGWDLLNGTQVNAWYVGSATSHGGTRSMYISNNNGTSNSYSTSDISYTYAVRTFNFSDTGEYAYSYDWKGQGESNYYDFSRAFIAPANYTWTAGINPVDGTYAFSTWAVPAGWFDITENFGSPATLAQSTTWRTATGTFHINTPGTYNLVFAWANDGSGGTNPATAIDNVSIVQNLCPSPENFTLVNGTNPDSIHVSWTPSSEASEYIIAVVTSGGTPDTVVDPIIVNDDNYAIFPLESGNLYDIYMRIVCMSGDSSLWVGPLVCAPGSYTMLHTGSDTLHTCHAVIYDEGGATGQYTNNADAYLVIYPNGDSLLRFSGWAYTESSIDYLKIYNGVGTSGSILWATGSSSSRDEIPVTVSDGPITLHFYSDGSVLYDGFELQVSCLGLPDCPNPTDFHLVSSAIDTVAVAWTDTAFSSNWQIGYGITGLNPDTLTDNIINVTDTMAYLTNLSPSNTYDIYVRTDCGSEYSWWIGPVTVTPGSINMPVTGTMSITACALTVFDDGGALGQYTNNANSSLTIYPSSTDSIIRFSGWAYTESSIDYLRIYDGVGTSGSLLWQTSSSSVRDNIPSTLSTEGPITLMWHTDGSVVYDGFELNISCAAAPQCRTIRNLRAENVAGTSARILWNISNAGGEVSYFEVETYQGSTLVSADTTSATAIWVTGLNPGVNYSVNVRGVCAAGGYNSTETVTFQTTCLSGGDIEISGGSTSNSYYPLNGSQSYSYTQEIYTNAQIGGAATFRGISYYAASSLSTRNITLYLGETTQSAFTGVSDYVPLTQLHQVYSGNFSASGSGWVDIFFDSTFTYTGSGNLVVALDDNTGSSGGGSSFRTRSGSYQALHYFGSSDVNPASPSGSTQLNTTVQNDIRLYSECDTTATCVAPNVITTDITPTQIDIEWVPGLNETSWEVAHRAASASSWTIDAASTSATTYSVSGLSPNTQYQIRVTPACGGDSVAATVIVQTDCGYLTLLPFTEDFENCATGSSSTGSAFVTCWNRLNNGTSYGGYPYVSSSSTYNHTTGGTKGLYWYNSTTTGTYGDYECVVLPAVDTTIFSIDSLQVSFWAKASSTSYYPVFYVGVMSDPTDVNTFQPFDTITINGNTNWELYEVPFVGFTGHGQNFAVLATRPTSSWYAYVDDFTIERIPTCLNVTNIQATGASETTITLDWTDRSSPSAWQVEYGPAGHIFGSSASTVINVSSHPVTITGLDTLTNYDFYVRPICSSTDTGRWSQPATISTASCADAHITAIGSPSSTGTTYYVPLNNYYNYTLTETIIDSAELNGAQDISIISFYYAYSSPSVSKTNCTIYFQPTNKTAFTSSSDIVALNPATAVKVYEGPMNCVQGWNHFALDTLYSYDGNGGILVIVDDNSYDYDGSAYVFKSESCSAYKSISYYSDSENPDVTTPSSFSGNKGYYQYRAVMQLTSCGGTSCGTPVITGETHDYQSATITWNGSGNAYEVSYKETAATTWSTETPVMGNTYTFTGLRPSTNYSFRVRQDCNADSLGYSEWTLGGFVTDSLPCLAPDSLNATAVTNATATLDWNVLGNETNWDIHVWAAGFDSIYRVAAHPATVGGFTAGVTYNATVRALCGTALIEGDWSDATQFTTATCPDVTGLATSNVTAHSVTLNWTADPMAESWKIEYGYRGTPQGQGTVVTVNTNTYTVTGLSDETSYQFYVQAVCGTGWESEQWAEVFATTAASTGDECNPVSNLTVSDITTNSAMVTWFSESGSAWNVVVPEANVDDIVYDQQYALTGLLANTNYNVKVRTVCDNDQYSDFVTTSFMTEQEEGIDGVETMNCTIYPNPTSSATTISVSGVNGKVKIAIIDMNGRTVASETLECASDCVKTMDVENLAQGAYFVRITGESVNMVKKLVVR